MSEINQTGIENLLKRLYNCDLCPRNCKVNRQEGMRGICGQTSQIRISSANLHFGEEPPISGEKGSGTIFLTGCSLKCVYCQNYPISQMNNGTDITPLTLVDRMLELQRRGAHNINFVTPTHFGAQIAKAIFNARKRGLRIPIVYNTSGYEKVEILRELEGLIEIYMPDMRYGDSEAAECYSNAPDYPEVNRAAIAEMYRQVGELSMDSEGIARHGLLIRHMILPNKLSQSEEIFKFIAEKISKKEYLIAKKLMEKYNLRNGWMQDEIL